MLLGSGNRPLRSQTYHDLGRVPGKSFAPSCQSERSSTNPIGASARVSVRYSDTCDRAVASGATAELRLVRLTVADRYFAPRFGSSSDMRTPRHTRQGPTRPR